MFVGTFELRLDFMRTLDSLARFAHGQRKGSNRCHSTSTRPRIGSSRSLADVATRSDAGHRNQRSREPSQGLGFAFTVSAYPARDLLRPSALLPQAYLVVGLWVPRSLGS